MKLCVLLPTFNNQSTIGQMVAEIEPYGFPILIVNDGSGPEMAVILAQLEARDSVTVVHRQKNGGKGAAVMDGIRWAHKAGFTHVLQIDADAQHRTADIPRFVDAARISPDALILGKPVFPENTPSARLKGRKISVVWVWIETLSKVIKDPLFGFRVYPVADTIAAARSPFIGRRMDFDTEIAVRLVWRGLQVVTLETPVKYYADGVSHFHYFYDNVRISWMHTRLFLGMIPRSWKLLGRRIVK